MGTKKDKTAYNQEDLKSEDLALHYWGSLDNLVSLIKSSELKAGLILTFFGIIFNFVYQNIERVKESLTNYNFLYVLLSLYLISTLLSIYFSVKTFIPRIEKKYEPNIFFFGDINSKFGDIHKFSKTFLNTVVDREKVFDQIGQQIYVNAKITTLKFKNVNASIRYLVVSLSLLGLLTLSEIVIILFFK